MTAERPRRRWTEPALDIAAMVLLANMFYWLAKWL